MAAIKIEMFHGKAPKVSPEHLPESASQVANNTKLYSGDLIPYRLPASIKELSTPATVNTIFGMYDDADTLQWLSWQDDVDVITRSDIDDGSSEFTLDRRFFFTGDGKPKQSWLDYVLDGAEPYPGTRAFTLGLPLPTAKPTVSVASFSELDTTDAGRDNASKARLRFSSNHGLRDGNIISVAGFTGAKAGLNTENVEVEVLDADEIYYFNRGDSITFGADTNGRVNLAGGRTIRSYVYTWITPFGEESVPSAASDDVYMREGQTATISNLPTATPAAEYFVRGIRLYRLVVTANGGEYLRLKTLWFPGTTATVQRTSNVATVALDDMHNLIVGDRFKLNGCTDASFDDTTEVTEVVDRYTFKYANVGADTAETADVTGTLYHDVAETTDDPAVYWGDGTYNFTDDFESRNLTFSLPSQEYDAPPDDMQGLTLGPNNIALGFVGNQLCMSEPFEWHAWPERNRITFDYDVVAVGAVMGTIVVLTKGYPYRVEGTYPDTMSHQRIESLYPCVSKRSVVPMDYGLVYASQSGLVMYSPNTGVQAITKLIHDWDTWDRDIIFEDIVAAAYQNKYIASYGSGAFLYERKGEEGEYIDISAGFDAVWVDKEEHAAYFVDSGTAKIFRWDELSYPYAPMAWRSKVFKTEKYVNFGVARVIADFGVPAGAESIEAYNLLIIAENQAAIDELLAAGLEFLGTYNAYQFNGGMFNGDTGLTPLYDATVGLNDELVFSMWVDKELLFQTTITDMLPFRLPTGYRSDTFEFGVSGAVRVRAIHIAETQQGLKNI